jgi:serine/threonine-protein kinase ATR
MLQAQQNKTPFSFVQSTKLVKATGEPLRALQELENSIKLTEQVEHPDDGIVIDLTGDDEEIKRMKAKASIIPLHVVWYRLMFIQAKVLHARWMNESDRYEMSDVQKAFQKATDLWPKLVLRISLPSVDVLT